MAVFRPTLDLDIFIGWECKEMSPSWNIEERSKIG